tara:strand:+ start:258 stop:386 length:129 start_codon:yes stop_codon:yes gene_type:complete
MAKKKLKAIKIKKKKKLNGDSEEVTTTMREVAKLRGRRVYKG